MLTVRYLLLALAVLQSHPPQKQKPDTSHHVAANDQRGTQQAPLTINFDSAQRRDEAESRDAERKEKAAPDDALISYTKWLAVIAFFQLLVFGYQALQLKSTVGRMRDAERLTGESVKQMERAADAAKESADATRATVLKMDEIAQRQLRAYLGIARAKILSPPATGQSPNVGIQIQNFGQTPASEVAITVNWEIGAYPHVGQEEFPAGDPIVFGPREGYVLDPGDSIALGTLSDTLLTAVDANRINSGRDESTGKTIALCVHGYIRYRDVFGGRHVREFCQFYGGALGVSVAYCQRHNTEESDH